jgi:hypothetical protein
MRLSNFVRACTVALLLPVVASAQHADVKPDIQNGRIVTDGWIDALSQQIDGLQVFSLDFQEDPLDPFVINDPGFNTVGASALPAGSQLILKVPNPALFGLSANLSYWNGSGPVSFGPVPSGETLRLNKGTQDRTLGNDATAISYLNIGAAGANGSLHQHLNSFLQGSDGNVDPSDGIVPAEGIYLFPFQLGSSDAGIADSRPLFLVYNNGQSEAVHDAAIAWVETNLVPIPEPATAVLMAVGAVAFSVLQAAHCRRHSGPSRQPV